MLLEKYIREALSSVVISERNYPQFFKKPFDYELLVFDYGAKEISEIYRALKKSEHGDSVSVEVSSLDDDGFEPEEENYSLDSRSAEEIIDKRADVISQVYRQLKLTVPKTDSVIAFLENRFNFEFSDTSVRDNKPVVIVNSSEIGSFIRGNKGKNHVKDLYGMSWILHDFGHLEDFTHGSGEGAPGVNSKNLKTNYMKTKTYINKYLNEAEKTSYWKGIISAWFNKIGYTPDVSSRDIEPSIYAYCLSGMSSAEDAYNMNFRILNDDENVVVVSPAENRWLQKFFANTYKTVHADAIFSRFDSEGGSHKIKDGFIYILKLMP